MSRALSSRLAAAAASANHAPLPSKKRAALALLLACDDDGTEHALFILRAKNPRDTWGGHVGLPGGRRGAKDADDESAAVRETLEEVGVDLRTPGEWRAMGRLVADRTLDKASTSGPHLTISLFGFARAHPGLQKPLIDVSEVQYAWWVPTSTLCQEGLFWYDRMEKELAGSSKPPAGPLRLVAPLGLAITFPGIRLPRQDGVGRSEVLWGITLSCISEVRVAAGEPALVGPAAAQREFRHVWRGNGIVSGLVHAAMHRWDAVRSTLLVGAGVVGALTVMVYR